MPLHHLRGRKICDRVMRKGKVWRGRTMAIRWLPGPPPHPSVRPNATGLFVGTVASNRLSKSSVERNRMRRRCREALRLAVQQHPDLPATQLLLCPLLASLSASFSLIEADVRVFLSTLHGR